jgi:hypothetical protein
MSNPSNPFPFLTPGTVPVASLPVAPQAQPAPVPFGAPQAYAAPAPVAPQAPAAPPAEDPLEKYLREGAGRAQRLPRLSIGRFRLLLDCMKAIGEKKQFPGPQGMQEFFITEAFILEAVILSSTDEKLPVGTRVGTYLRWNSPTEFADGDKKDRAEFVRAVAQSLGVEANMALYTSIFSETGFAQVGHGVSIDVSTRQMLSSKKNGSKPKFFKDGVTPVLLYQWEKFVNTPEIVGQGRQWLAQMKAQAGS